MGVNFYLDSSYEGAEGEKYIYYDYSVFGFRIRKSTGFKIHPKYFKHQRVKEDYPESFEINHKLDLLTTRSRRARIHFLSQMIKPTKDEFIKMVFVYEERSIEDIDERFKNFLEDFCKGRTGSVRISHQTAWNAFRSFAPSTNYIDSKMIDGFSKSLIEKNHSPNYIVKLINNIEHFANYLGIKLEDRKTIITRKKSDSIALTLDEVNKLIDAKLPSQLSKVRDIFVFQCYTGLRYSDIQKFDKSFIQFVEGVKCLIFFSQKTKNKSIIPLFKPAKNILEKYGNILPITTSGQKFNESLKKVCELSGINEKITMTKLTGHTKKIITIPKYQAITSHSGRRVFVTLMSQMGLTPKEISLMTGHTQQSIVDIYDKSKADMNAIKVFNTLNDRL